MKQLNQKALAVLSLAGISGSAFGQSVAFGENYHSRSFRDTLGTTMTVDVSVGFIQEARIQLGGLAVVHALVQGIIPGSVSSSCVRGDPCEVDGQAFALETPDPRTTNVPGTSVGAVVHAEPDGNCIISTPRAVAIASAFAGIHITGYGVGTTELTMGRASAHSCWITQWTSGCCDADKTEQSEYGIAVLGAIQEFEISRPSMTPTTVTVTHTVVFESERESVGFSTLGLDCTPVPTCPISSPLEDTVIYMEISGLARAGIGVVDSDFHYGLMIAKADGTFDVYGVFDDSSFDPSSGFGTLILNSMFTGLIDEISFSHTILSLTLPELLSGDVDGNGEVCGDDRVAFMAALGSSIGDANYNIRADFNLDGQVDLDDLAHLNTIGCTADFDCDGALTIFDQTAFANLFAAEDPAADFDGDGLFTVFDFMAFGNVFSTGCP